MSGGFSDLEVFGPQAGYVQARGQTCPITLVKTRFRNSRKFDDQRIWCISQ
jgi:hypothetical protein